VGCRDREGDILPGKELQHPYKKTEIEEDDIAEDWEVLALRYATAQLPAQHLALDADPHDAPGQLDYFIWVIRGPTGVIVVDTGYLPAEGERRGRTLLRHPAALLAAIGIDAAEVRDVVLTHLHYDHAGNLPLFPKARFHLQARDMEFATGRCMCHSRMRRAFFVEDIVEVVRHVYAERVQFHDGDADLLPGVTLHLVGGHSRGLQAVRVETRSRPIVLASDALHLDRLLEEDAVFPIFADIADVYQGYRIIRQLAGPHGILVPGHDPSVLTRFPRLHRDEPDIVVIR
jgi:glyoxylase-like metal-dependent hydrolase (beta-lactamase superfamily II)